MSDQAVEVRDLGVRFGRFRALTGMTFAVPRGGFLAILGPNGGGKTTLIRALLGLIPADEGAVRLFGRPPEEHDPSRVSYVPQIKSLDRTFPAVVLELVVSGLRRRWPWMIGRADRERALATMRSLGVEHLAQKPVGQLSGGELQRVYLARGLVRRPQLLVLDEPATGMDTPGEAELYHLLEHYQEDSGATVIMITHDWAVARHHATHVLLMNRAMRGFGPPGEVLSDENLRLAFGHSGHHHPMTVE